MKEVFCISGLGADERIFSRLQVPGVCFNYLQWLIPEKEETIEDYARRMSRQIDRRDRSDGAPRPADLSAPIFIGVSFGGMMAIELAKIYPGARVILVSSVKSRRELPVWMRLVGNMGLYRLVPSKRRSIARSNALLREFGANFLGAESPEEFRLTNEYRENVNPEYLTWAVKQVVRWKNDWQPGALYHIHGSKDKTFPIRSVAATHVIPGAGHFLVMNRAEEMNRILTAIL